jgi:hypothetical protein
MISLEKVKELAIKEQTTEINILRDYFQNLFLSYFYQKERSERILFKGGTALRIIYQSPRYSEDLDFSGINVRVKEIKELIEKTIKEISYEGVEVEIKESKSTSGGYLGILNAHLWEWRIKIQVEISLRSLREIKGEAILISSPFIAPYTLFSLPEEELISEKIKAVLKRKKPRDFFDLYFILRKGIGRKIIAPKKKEILKRIEKIDNQLITQELKVFLPKNYWPILRSFKENLRKELERR